MKSTFSRSHHQAGFAHLGIMLAIVGVIAIGGLVAWRFLGASKDSSASVSTQLAQKLASAKCDYDDKDLCKFFVSYKEHKQFKMVTISKMSEEYGGNSTSTYEVDGDNSHMVSTGSYASETIVIGDSTYTRTPNGTWWKQTAQPADSPASTSVDTTETIDFTEPTKDESTDQTVYKALGKEACGSLTCFKYQVISKDMEDVTEYIWFDTKDYQLRRSTYISEGMNSDTTFSYEKVSIKAPTSYKELGPNQYIIPGDNEPTTLPSASDYMAE